jgi:hypothetical protein
MEAELFRINHECTLSTGAAAEYEMLGQPAAAKDLLGRA